MGGRQPENDRSAWPRIGAVDRVLRVAFVLTAMAATAAFGWLRYDDRTSGGRVPRSLVQDVMSGGQPLRQRTLAASEIVVVYSNYECRFCVAWADSIEALLSVGERAHVRIKHLATPAAAAGAFEGATAAECAAEQGAFPAYHRALLRSQRFARDALLALGVEAGVPDSSAFAQCLDDERYSHVVRRQTEEAALAGIRGTPATIVRRTIFTGLRPIADIRKEAGW